MVAYGAVALLVLPCVRARPRWVRWAPPAVAALVCAAVGAGLVWRGYHWPLDVLGSWCLGTPLLAAVLAASGGSGRFPNRPDPPGGSWAVPAGRPYKSAPDTRSTTWVWLVSSYQEPSSAGSNRSMLRKNQVPSAMITAEIAKETTPRTSPAVAWPLPYAWPRLTLRRAAMPRHMATGPVKTARTTP
ncbi:hypothetical protein ACGRHY_06905 [Streptomyces sp. HK10]|uniref:hypothetical protein n=1 Tax=Streptomyces sp. HK10 TaxID=3373255 RepID=UPI00374A8F71